MQDAWRTCPSVTLADQMGVNPRLSPSECKGFRANSTGFSILGMVETEVMYLRMIFFFIEIILM